MEKNFFKIGLLFLIILCTSLIIASCSNDPNNSRPDSSLAEIESVDDATINGDEIFMLVDSDTKELSLSNKIHVSAGSTWKLYFDSLGQTEIATKIATGQNGELQNGDNIFYIVVISNNNINFHTYKIIIHRSHFVTVSYLDGTNVIKSENILSGSLYKINYTPSINGYIFNGWRLIDGSKVTEFTPWHNTNLYIDKSAIHYNAVLDVNQGNSLENNTISFYYGEALSLPVPTRTGYTFLGWFVGETAFTDSNGITFSIWNVKNPELIVAHWEINHYNIFAKANDTEAGTISGNGVYNYNEKVTLAAKTNNGYNFIGWYDDHDVLISSESQFTFHAVENTSYTAKWNYFTLTTTVNYFNAGTTEIYKDEKISIGENITLSAVDYKNVGYIWKGWSLNGNIISNELNINITMDNFNAEYIAVWDVVEELKNFDFISTQNSCEIINIKDKNTSEIIVPNYITSIKNGAFSGCSMLSYLSLPFVGYSSSEMESSEKTLFGYIFGTQSYPGAVKVVQRYDDTPFNLSSTYYIPSKLKEIKINGGPVFFGAFYNCSMIKNIEFGKDVDLIDKAVLSGCSGLLDLTIPFVGKTMTSDESKEAMFGFIFGEQEYANSTAIEQWYGASSDKVVKYYVPNSLEKVNITSATNIPFGAFSHCTTIKEIYLPESIKTIGDRAFSYTSSLKKVYWNPTNCSSLSYSSPIFMFSNLESVVLGDNVESIPDAAFASCFNLKTVIINSNSKLKTIGSNAFIYCYALSDIYLPKGLNQISFRAFFACTNLQKVNYAGNMTDWENIIIESENDPLIQAQITYNYNVAA